MFQNDDAADRPSYQALVDPLQSDESAESKQESIAAPPPQHKHEQTAIPPSSIPIQSQFEQSTPIQIKLPLELDFDDIAGVCDLYFFYINIYFFYIRIQYI